MAAIIKNQLHDQIEHIMHDLLLLLMLLQYF